MGGDEDGTSARDMDEGGDAESAKCGTVPCDRELASDN